MFLNSSRIGVWNLCHRKFFFLYLFGGTGLSTGRAEYLSFGVAAHHGLSAMYSGVELDAAVALARDMYMSERSESMGGMFLADWEEDADLLERVLRAYAVRTEPVDDFAVLNTEREFCVPLGEVCYACGVPYTHNTFTPENPIISCVSCGVPIHYWVGRTDLDVNRDGHPTIIDHKTTSSTPSDDFLAGFGNSFQLLGYVYGRGKSDGYIIESFGVNALQKAATIGTEQAESKRCPDCRAGKRAMPTCTTCNATGRVEKQIKLEPFRRRYFPVIPSDLDRFVLTMHTHQRDMAEQAERFANEPEISYPMNDKACKFGPCPFFGKLCWGPNAATQWYKPDDVQLEEFSPREPDYVDNFKALIREEV